MDLMIDSVESAIEVLYSQGPALIRGANLDNGIVIVTVGGFRATVVSKNDTEITIRLPNIPTGRHGVQVLNKVGKNFLFSNVILINVEEDTPEIVPQPGVELTIKQKEALLEPPDFITLDSSSSSSSESSSLTSASSISSAFSFSSSISSISSLPSSESTISSDSSSTNTSASTSSVSSVSSLSSSESTPSSVSSSTDTSISISSSSSSSISSVSSSTESSSSVSTVSTSSSSISSASSASTPSSLSTISSSSSSFSTSSSSESSISSVSSISSASFSSLSEGNQSLSSSSSESSASTQTSLSSSSVSSISSDSSEVTSLSTSSSSVSSASTETSSSSSISSSSNSSISSNSSSSVSSLSTSSDSTPSTATSQTSASSESSISTDSTSTSSSSTSSLSSASSLSDDSSSSTPSTATSESSLSTISETSSSTTQTSASSVSSVSTPSSFSSVSSSSVSSDSSSTDTSNSSVSSSESTVSDVSTASSESSSSQSSVSSSSQSSLSQEVLSSSSSVSNVSSSVSSSSPFESSSSSSDQLGQLITEGHVLNDGAGGTITFSRGSTATNPDDWSEAAIDERRRKSLEVGPGTFEDMDLIEEERTNQVLHSNDFANAVWTGNSTGTGIDGTVDSNVALAPDGTMTADRVNLNAGSNGTSEIRQSITSPGSPSNFSVWLKTESGTVTIRLRTDGSSASVTQITIDATWRKYFTAKSSSKTIVRILQRSDAGDDLGSLSVLAWGAQCEEGWGPSSNIETTSSAVTRSEDDWQTRLTSLPDGGFDQAGTIMMYWIPQHNGDDFDQLGSFIRGFASGGSALRTNISSRGDVAANRMNAEIESTNNEPDNTSYTASQIEFDVITTQAVTWDTNAVESFDNGVSADSAGTIPGGFEKSVDARMGMRSSPLSGSLIDYLNGWFLGIFWDRILTDDEIQVLADFVVDKTTFSSESSPFISSTSSSSPFESSSSSSESSFSRSLSSSSLSSVSPASPSSLSSSSLSSLSSLSLSSLSSSSSSIEEIPDSGLLLWLDADDSESFVLTGSDVDLWNDKSGNNNDAVQEVSSNKPAKVNGVQNGKPVVRFDGSDDNMALSDLLIPNNVTAFFVTRNSEQSSGGSAHRSVLASEDDPYQANGKGYGFGYSRSDVDGFRVALGDGTENDLVTSSKTSTENMEIVSFIKNGANAEIWRNQVSDVTGTLTRTSDFSTGYRLGADINSSERFYDGDVAEIIIYDRVLSDAEKLQVESYLEDKWGIELKSSSSSSISRSESSVSGGDSSSSVSGQTSDSSVSSLSNSRSSSSISRSLSSDSSSSVSFVTSGSSSSSVEDIPAAGLELWLDADDPDSFDLDGLEVITWSDKSGNNNDAVQNTSANRPLRNTGQFNGMATVEFDGIDEFMSMSSLLLGNNITAFFVSLDKEQSSGGSIHRPFLAADNDPFRGDGNGFGFGYLRSDGADDGFNVSLGDGSNEDGLRDNRTPTGNYEIVTVVKDADTFAGLWRDQELEDDQFVMSRTSGFHTGYELGAETGSSARYYDGNLAEIIIYNRVLSDAEKLQVESYLEDKWGIELKSSSSSSRSSISSSSSSTSISSSSISRSLSSSSSSVSSFSSISSSSISISLSSSSSSVSSFSSVSSSSISISLSSSSLSSESSESQSSISRSLSSSSISRSLSSSSASVDANFLVDENGDFIVDENGNFIVADN